MSSEPKVQLESLPRRELQALAKQHGIKANSKNSVLIAELTTVIEAEAPASPVTEDSNSTKESNGVLEEIVPKASDSERICTPSVERSARTPKTGKRKDFGKIHEKLFSAQKSIADHYHRRVTKPSGPVQSKSTLMSVEPKHQTKVAEQRHKQNSESERCLQATVSKQQTNNPKLQTTVALKENNAAGVNKPIKSRTGPKLTKTVTQSKTPSQPKNVVLADRDVNTSTRKRSTTQGQSTAKKQFDLKESLKRPISWQMKTGPLVHKQLQQSQEQTPAKIAPKTSRAVSTGKRLSAARPTKASIAARATKVHRTGPKSFKERKDARLARHENVAASRAKASSDAIMSRRGLRV